MFLKMYLLLNGEDERGEQEWKQRPTGRPLVQVRNDEGLDDGGSSGSSESLYLKYIFEIQPTGVTNWMLGVRKKTRSQE